MSDLTTAFYRIMAMQETGEECCARNRVQGFETANELARQVWEAHPEWRQVWVEREDPVHRYRSFED